MDSACSAGYQGIRSTCPERRGLWTCAKRVILRFQQDYFLKNPSKTGQATSAHFWTGEGTSNQFFEAVTHWQPLPARP
ncbi:MAG: DUF551 domain-containing protein [Flavobacteriales bacterium]|nr:DUF551 domain-containing protein [Flavobacteriales bacterium]